MAVRTASYCLGFENPVDEGNTVVPGTREVDEKSTCSCMLVDELTGMGVWLDEVNDGVRIRVSGASRETQVVLDEQVGRQGGGQVELGLRARRAGCGCV